MSDLSVSPGTAAEARAPATLRSLTTEWFLFLTAFRSNQGSIRSRFTHDAMHEELRARLRAMEAAAEPTRALALDFDAIRRPLIYFADEVLIYGSEWSGQQTWPADTLEYRELQTREGGDRFFELLEEELRHSDTSRLEVFLLCLTLGFEGCLRGDADRLREKRHEVVARLRLDQSDDRRISPQAYGRDESSHELFPPDLTTKILIGTVALVAAILALAHVGFAWIEDDLVRTACSILGEGGSHP